MYSYMNDILLLSKDEMLHQRDLIILLEELGKGGWEVNWDKCQFCQQSFDYLGVTLRSDGMHPTEATVNKFTQAQMPTTIKGWRQVAGWVAHSARFIWRGSEVLQLFKQVKLAPSEDKWK